MTFISTGLVYLATPYTKFPGGIDKAFDQAARIAGHLLQSGLTIFCPIAHGHSIMRAAGLDHRDPAVFAALNHEMLRHAGVLIVAQMDGWQDSEGIKEEIAYFERHHKRIYDLDPHTLAMTSRREPHMTSGEQPRTEAELAPE